MPHFFCTLPHLPEEIDTIISERPKKRETMTGNKGGGWYVVRLTIKVEPGFRKASLLAIDY